MSETKKMNRTLRIVITTVAVVLIIALAVLIYFCYGIYKGKDNALNIALADCGISAQQAKGVEVDYDRYLDGIIYEVEFYYLGQKHQYKIDSDGEILEGSKRVSDTDSQAQGEVSTSNQLTDSSAASSAENKELTADEARQIAFSYAGANAAVVKDLEIDVELKDGIKVYEIDFEFDGYDYSYIINSTDGKVVDNSKEHID